MISKVFKSRFPSCNYVFKDGTSAHFIAGTYATSDTTKSDELMNEIKVVGKGKSMHEFLFVDENEVEVDSEALTPIEILKAEMYAQALADIQAGASGKDSTSDASGVAASFSNTVNSASVAAESTGGSVSVGIAGAKLANLQAALTSSKK